MSAINGVGAAAQQISSSQRSAARSAAAMSTGQSQDMININQSNKLSREAAIAQVGAANGEAASAKYAQAHSTLERTNDILDRMEQLAVRASSGDLNASDRAVLNAEAQQLSIELSETLDKSSFNGQKLFDGASTTTRVDGEVSMTNPDGVNITDPLAGLDLSTQAGASAALDQISDAQLATAVEQTKVSSNAARMERAVTSAQNKAANASNAAAEIGGADIAKEAASFISSQVQHQAAMFVTKSMHQMEADAVSTLLK